MAVRRRVVSVFMVVAVLVAGVTLERSPAASPGIGGAAHRSAPPAGALSSADPAFSAGMGREHARRERLDDAGAKALRERSRVSYRGVGAERALRVGQAVFADEFTTPLFDGARPAAGLNVVKRLGGGAAVAQTDGGRKLLLRSTLPLSTRTRGGEQAPVDLGLTRSGEAFRSVNPLVDVRMAREITDGLTFPEGGFSVTPVGTANSAATQTVDRLFYANTQPDVDVLVTPRTAGAELSWQLRSPASPERFVLDVDLPAGAVLRRARTDDPIPGDPPRAIEIARGDEALGYVSAPLAYDADGVSVPSRAAIDGDRIIVTAEHRGADVRYPLLVDPEVAIPASKQAIWHGWGASWVPTPQTPGVNYYGWALHHCAYNCNGVYMSMPTNTWYSPGGTGVNWSYRAPANTYVYRAILGNMAHAPLRHGYAFSLWYNGILAPSGWEPNVNYYNQSGQYGGNPFGPAGHAAAGIVHDFCALPRCNRAAGTEQNYAVIGLGASNPYTGQAFYTFGYSASLTMDWAIVYLGDRRAPTFRSATPPTRDWTDDNNAVHRPGHVSAHDDGLGLNGITLSGAAAGNGILGRPCSGDPHRSPCDPDYGTDGFSYTLNEGTTTLGLQARDIVDNTSTRQTWTEKIDRSAPVLSATGDLRDLAAGIDDSGRDLYGVKIAATDGTPSAPRVGVRDVIVKVDGAEHERLDSEPACVESCAVSDEVFLDTDELSEGPHTISVQAFDRLGHASPAIAWTIRVPREEHYAGKLASWKADVEQRVDNAVPVVPLTGPMPVPPGDWRHEADCEASTDTLRACYEAIQAWGASVRSWLSSNLAILSLAGELPDPPTFEYAKAADSTSLDLTRTMRDAFKLAKNALASPLERLNVAITFHEPTSPASVLQALPQLAAPDQVALTGVFDPDGGDLSGTMTTPTPMLLTDAIESLYVQQIAIAQEDITEVGAVVPEDADEAEANQQFLNEHQAFVSALHARQPFVTGVGAKTTLPALLDSLLDLDATQIIKSIRVLPSDEPLLGNGLELLTGTRTNTAVVRSAERRRVPSNGARAQLAPGAPRCYDPGAGGRGPMRSSVIEPTPTYWAPSRNSYNTSIGEPDGDHHLKVHRLRWRWKAAESLAWMCADSPGDRNVEIEAMVYPDDDERWSDNWESNNARKYTQHNGPAGGNIHQDDLASGERPPGYAYDKARFPDFAILFQSSQEFRYRRLYKVRFVTNEGHTDDTNSRVIYSVQATRRAKGFAEGSYCESKRQDYKSCMFAATTACIDQARIEEPFRRATVDWREIMGSGATRIGTIRKSKASVVDPKYPEVTARCDPRPPGSDR